MSPLYLLPILFIQSTAHVTQPEVMEHALVLTHATATVATRVVPVLNVSFYSFYKKDYLFKLLLKSQINFGLKFSTILVRSVFIFNLCSQITPFFLLFFRLHPPFSFPNQAGFTIHCNLNIHFTILSSTVFKIVQDPKIVDD